MEGQFVCWTSEMWLFKELISQISPPCKIKVDTFIIKRKNGQDMSNSLKWFWRTTLALALLDTSLEDSEDGIYTILLEVCVIRVCG